MKFFHSTDTGNAAEWHARYPYQQNKKKILQPGSGSHHKPVCNESILQAAISNCNINGMLKCFYRNIKLSEVKISIH
ncbi:MAG TPA: hypothetical protein DIC22_12585 [Chitinophagaceae bacterium]|nr:hypothetical protein [Chitinophagaceae bacterium]